MHFPADIYFILLLIIAGLLAGYTGALFGIGGAVLLVPTFLTIFKIFHAAPSAIMHNAIGTSLALVVPNGVIAAYKQYQAGKLDLARFKRWIPAVIAGALVGVSIVSFISANFIKWAFTIYLYICLLVTFLKKQTDANPNAGPKGLVNIIGGFVIGSVSVILGISGGTFTVPFYNALNYPLKRAIAIASATAIFVGAIGAVGTIIIGWDVVGRVRYSLGYVNLLAFFIITPLILVSSGYGVKTANRLSKTHLKLLYILFLLSLSAYMTWHVFH